MLSTIKVANFKAFAESQRVPVRPLTLIYGANSSGKSGILHALILARHAMETGDLIPQWRGARMKKLLEEMQHQGRELNSQVPKDSAIRIPAKRGKRRAKG